MTYEERLCGYSREKETLLRKMKDCPSSEVADTLVELAMKWKLAEPTIPKDTKDILSRIENETACLSSSLTVLIDYVDNAEGNLKQKENLTIDSIQTAIYQLDRISNEIGKLWLSLQ